MLFYKPTKIRMSACNYNHTQADGHMGRAHVLSFEQPTTIDIHCLRRLPKPIHCSPKVFRMHCDDHSLLTVRGVLLI